MEIDVSVIASILSIVGATLIVLVAIFYNDDNDEKKETQEEFPKVSKSRENPIDDNHEKPFTMDENDLNKEIATKNIDLDPEKIAKDNNEISNRNNLATENNKYNVTIAKNLDEKEDLNGISIEGKKVKENIKAVKVIIEGKVHELTLKDDIIFNYNNENYSSYVLDIKHDTVKIKYRSQEIWINLSDIKRIL